jgi:hypothetical protein
MRTMRLCLHKGLSLLQQKKRRPAGRRFFCCSKDKSTRSYVQGCLLLAQTLGELQGTIGNEDHISTAG